MTPTTVSENPSLELLASVGVGDLRVTTHLSRYFWQRRLALKVSFGELARRMGYKNTAKGANRIIAFERDNKIHQELFYKLAAALGITSNEIGKCVEADRADWEAWADEPIEPHLVARIMAAVYSSKDIPTTIQASRKAMEQFASDFARHNRWQICLVLSKRLRIWFEEDGTNCGVTHDTFEQSHGPYMRLGGRKFLLDVLNRADRGFRHTE